jgi:peroxiredoxin
MTEVSRSLVRPGDRAPDFHLPSTTGRPVGLAELRESGSVLLVFIAAECPTSRLTLERLQPIAEPLCDAGTVLVAVHQDPPEVAARTMSRCGATYRALSEPEPYTTSTAFGLSTVPTGVLVSSDGRVETVICGWDSDAYDRIATQAGVPRGRVPRAAPRFKPGCGAKNTYDAAALEAAPAADFDLLEDLFERGWTDGLPVIPPTRERVARMLTGADPAETLGLVPPALGEGTLERLAACAVLAGCHPSYFPVVRAAAEAMLDPAFNLHGMTNSTHSCGPVAIINGPVRTALGVNSGINTLGGWNRANATIGRALRLLVGLTGGGAPGRLDRATQGHPGKISFCFGENEEASPWEPLSVSRGFAPEESVVTLYCGDGPMCISNHYAPDPGDIVVSLAHAGGACFCPNAYPVAAETVYVICPEHAASFRTAGWSKRDVAERIFEAAKRPVRDLRRGEWLGLLASAPDDMMVSKWTTPDEIILIVAGGLAGRFSSVLPPWVGFGLGSQMVSRRIPGDAPEPQCS